MAAGLVILIIAVLLIIFTRLIKPQTAPCNSQALQNFRRVVAETLESGAQYHIGVGNVANGDFLGNLAALNLMRNLFRATLVSDYPINITCADGATVFLSQAVLRGIYQNGVALSLFPQVEVCMTGITPLAQTAAAIPQLLYEPMDLSILAGHLSPTAALLADAAVSEGKDCFAASDQISAQAVLFATASETLLGEEVFLLADEPVKSANRATAVAAVTSILRWVLIAVLLLGAVLKGLGVI